MDPRAIPIGILACLVATGCQMASNSHSGGVPETNAVRTARKVVEVTQQVERFTGRSFKSLPRIEKIPPSKRCSEGDSGMMESSIGGQRDPSVIRFDGIWQALGLVSDSGGSAENRRLHCANLEALFQSRQNRILLFMDSTAEFPAYSFAHEMVHALQNQQRPLRRLFDSIPEPDARQGLLGALEGEAEFVSSCSTGDMNQSRDCRQPTQGDLPLLEQKLRSLPGSSKISLGVSLPAYAPYVFGERLACELHQRLGTAGFDTLLARPPNGSWQLWNTVAYLQNLSPVDWDTGWKALPDLPAGWSPLGQVRVGESRVAALLLIWSRIEATKLLGGTGMGWRGDRIWVAKKGDSRAVFWRLAFETPRKAKEFARTWWGVRETRLGRKLTAWDAQRNYVAWKDSVGASYQVVVSGSEVGIGEGFDGARTAKMLVKCMHLGSVKGDAGARTGGKKNAAKAKPKRQTVEVEGRQSRLTRPSDIEWSRRV